MIIRKAKIEDIPAIVSMEARCFSRPWSEKSFLSELDSGDGYFTAAEDGGEVCGFCVARWFGDEGEIFNVCVSPEHRREGIGDALMKNTLEEAERSGIKRIFLEVRQSNGAARALYLKHGFQVCGLRKRYYDDPVEDAILMEADIGGNI